MNVQQRIVLEVAGISVELVYDKPGPVLRYYLGGDFTTYRETTEPTLSITLKAVETIPRPPESGLVFQAGQASWAFADRESIQFAWREGKKAGTVARKLTLNSDRSRGLFEVSDEVLRDGKTYDPLDFPVDQLLFIDLVGRREGILVHASGVSHLDRGYLFVGVSGSGKTTISRFWESRPGTKLLSGDRCIVRRAEGGYRVHGTPWGGQGTVGIPEQAELGGIFFLEKSDSIAVTEMSPEVAAMRLFRCSFPPFWDRDSFERQMSVIADLASSVPAYLLRFSLSEKVVDEVCALSMS